MTAPTPVEGRPLRTVLLVHGHPDYAAGGGEMAAYSLFRALQQSAPEDSYLVSAISPERARGTHGSRLIQVDASPYEWAFIAEGAEWLYQSTPSASSLQEHLIPFLVALNPDVVHVHHYIWFGLDLLRLLRKALPDARIVFTLHEYLAICTRDGQMLTRPDNTLCGKASQIRCTGCYPELSRAQIWMRETWFKRHFDLVGLFTTPSEFARQRYIAWGLAPEKIVVLPNAQLAVIHRGQPAPHRPKEKPVFAFFGQINGYKGVDLLLTAAARLRKLTTKVFEIQVHGVLTNHDPELKARILSAFEALGEDVTWRGPYDAGRVIPLMQGADFVVVPSIWWENSPVVIEEAFHAGRPVICADIGGMREKVADGVNGLHFRARDPESLAETLLRCIEDPALASVLAGGVRRLPSLAESDRSYRAAYDTVAAEPALEA